MIAGRAVPAKHPEAGRHDETRFPMALKCVTCGLLFRSRNELDWHVRQEHLRQRLPPTKNSQRRRRLRPRTGGERHVSATTIRPRHHLQREVASR